MRPDEQFRQIAEDIKTLYNHAFVQAHLVVVESYHEIGRLILTLPTKYSAVTDVARLTGISERTLYRAAKFYEMYPDTSTLPEGNNISWNKIITKYLPESKEDKVCEHTPISICSKCKIRL